MPENSPQLRRDRRALVRRERLRTRRRTLVTTTLVLAVSTLVGVGAAGSTYALLNDRATLSGATIQAGTLNLTVNGASSAGLGDWALTPGAAQAKAFTVSNAGDVISTISARSQITSTTAIGDNVMARITQVANAAACTTGLSGTQLPLGSYSNANLGTLAQNAQATYCLELSLKSTTPASQAGQGVNFMITIGGAQSAN